jgi:endonuclease G, mitochondrial
MDEPLATSRTLRPVTDRAGYDPRFLGVQVLLPTRPPEATPALIELPYTHFTVLLDPSRRLAAATAVGIDGATLMDPRGHRLGTRPPAAGPGPDR